MGNSKRQPERDREIQKIENAIAKLQIKIHQKKRELVTFTRDNETSIKKYTLELNCKKEKIEALGKRQETPTDNASEDTDMDADPVPVEHHTPDANTTPDSNPNLQLENALLVSLHGVKKSTPSRHLKKLVAWQMERHIQWATPKKQRPWTTITELCSVLDIRTADELKRDIPMGQGNLQLNQEYCRLEVSEFPWGAPAALLREYADSKSSLKDPDAWILEMKARALLIDLENWYFSLDDEERYLWEYESDRNLLELPMPLHNQWRRVFKS